MGNARSNYKQVRLTLTEERGGRISIRCMVKPPQADWTMKHLLWTRRYEVPTPIPDMNGVYAFLLDVLSQPTLPEES